MLTAFVTLPWKFRKGNIKVIGYVYKFYQPFIRLNLTITDCMIQVFLQCRSYRRLLQVFSLWWWKSMLRDLVGVSKNSRCRCKHCVILKKVMRVIVGFCWRRILWPVDWWAWNWDNPNCARFWVCLIRRGAKLPFAYLEPLSIDTVYIRPISTFW